MPGLQVLFEALLVLESKFPRMKQLKVFFVPYTVRKRNRKQYNGVLDFHPFILFTKYLVLMEEAIQEL